MNKHYQKSKIFGLPKNRKAQMVNKLVFYILLLAGAIIIFTFIVKIQQSITTGMRGEMSACYTTMTLKTYTTMENKVYMVYGGIGESCPTYKVNISNEKTIIYEGEKKFDTIKYKELTNDKVNEIISDEIKYCWEQFGSGKLDAFWLAETFSSDFLPGSGTSEGMIGCRICSQISFEDKTKEYTGLKEFMKNREYGRKIKTENKDLTYYHVIAEHQSGCSYKDSKYLDEGENCWESFAVSDDGPWWSGKDPIDTNKKIDSSKDYYVVFIRQGIEKDDGVMNAYLMSGEEYNNPAICEYPLPYMR